LRIFSLPQEWLWCETWCSDETKPKAKTIDLCNNPLTKAPKLDNALRIVEEWPDYDGQIKALEEEIARGASASSSSSSSSGGSSSHVPSSDEADIE